MFLWDSVYQKLLESAHFSLNYFFKNKVSSLYLKHGVLQCNSYLSMLSTAKTMNHLDDSIIIIT